MKSYSRFIKEWRDNYFSHQTSTKVTADDVSDEFIDRLGLESYEAKEGLRNFFRKSPNWDESRQCLVLKGELAQEPDRVRIRELVKELFSELIYSDEWEYSEKGRNLKRGLRYFYFSGPESGNYWGQFLKDLGYKAYKKGRKKSRVLTALCKECGIWTDEKGSDFQKTLAKACDELNRKTEPVTLYVSINPGHILSMSNPKYDKRGSTMVSCHSMNSLEYEYNSGCIGYCRDKVTFMAFTVKNDKEENFYNRKTSRQLFFYKPGNGILLQSRLYKTQVGTTGGGTTGHQPESDLYRDLIQKEIANLEGLANSWETSNYEHNCRLIQTNANFGGYKDWLNPEFDPTISYLEGDLKRRPLTIGEYGMDLSDGEDSDYILEPKTICSCCGEPIDPYYGVHETADGPVCDYCLESLYYYCSVCGRYHHDRNMYRIAIGHASSNICEDCHRAGYDLCTECGEVFRDDELIETPDGLVCSHCLIESGNAACCDNCGELIYIDYANCIDLPGHNSLILCEDCSEEYRRCGHCDTYYERSEMIEGEDGWYCPDCWDEITVPCAHCGHPVEKSEAKEDEQGNYYHETCFYHDHTYCLECGKPVLKADAVHESDYIWKCHDCRKHNSKPSEKMK